MKMSAHFIKPLFLTTVLATGSFVQAGTPGWCVGDAIQAAMDQAQGVDIGSSATLVSSEQTKNEHSEETVNNLLKAQDKETYKIVVEDQSGAETVEVVYVSSRE